jgi:hypothetical protein
MTKLEIGIPIAAAVVLSAMPTPIWAQQVIYEPGYCAQFYPNANCQNMGPNNPYTGDYQRRQAYRYHSPAPTRRYPATVSRGFAEMGPR